MTENDEKLYKEIENCLEYEYDIFYGDSVFVHTTSIENLMEWFKNKQKELLKDFVRWLGRNMFDIKCDYKWCHSMECEDKHWAVDDKNRDYKKPLDYEYVLNIYLSEKSGNPISIKHYE